MRRLTALAFAMVLVLAIPYGVSGRVPAEPVDCKVRTGRYGNLTVETYSAACHSLTPFYWKNGVTQNAAKAMLRRLGLDPFSIIPGGFNTNMPGLREPVDFVEIEDKVIVGRSDFWPILFESKGKTPAFGIARVIADLPRTRRWAIASGPWIVIKNGTGTPEFTVQFFGNNASGEPWLEYTYRRKGSTLAIIKRVDHRKTWDSVHRRLVFDWTRRRAVFLNKDGTVFAIVRGTINKDGTEGRADALAIAKLMVILGYSQAIMMDGGSATAPSALNPVYLAVTAKR